MESDYTHRCIEIKFVSAENENVRDVRRHILPWVKRGSGTKYAGVSSNSMTAWVSILLMSGTIFKDCNKEDNREGFKLPVMLQEVVTAL